MRLRMAWLLSGFLAVSAACSVTPSPGPLGSGRGTQPPASAISGSAGPAASAQLLAIDDLPLVEPDPETLTAICDPYPNQLDPEAGEATLFCFDSIVLGLRVMQTVSDQPVLRAYLIRPTCPPVPCSAESLHTGTLAVWIKGGAYAFLLDSRASVVSAPVPIGGNNWPTVGFLTPPPVGRENILPAPPEVAARVPLPYCGHAGFDVPEPALACFRKTVLLGQPAEVVRDGAPIERGAVIDIVRFDGAGAITRFQRADQRWVQQQGGLILGPGDDDWDFEPWGAGVVLG